MLYLLIMHPLDPLFLMDVGFDFMNPMSVMYTKNP